MPFLLLGFFFMCCFSLTLSYCAVGSGCLLPLCRPKIAVCAMPQSDAFAASSWRFHGGTGLAAFSGAVFHWHGEHWCHKPLGLHLLNKSRSWRSPFGELWWCWIQATVVAVHSHLQILRLGGATIPDSWTWKSHWTRFTGRGEMSLWCR